MNKKPLEVDINHLVVKVYNEIALWNNEDGTPHEKKESLKVVAHGIVETVLSDALNVLNVKTGIKNIPGEPVKEKKKGIWNKIFS